MKRVLVGLGIIALGVALFVAPPAQTLASWSDAEVGTGSYSASLAKPAILTCTSKNVFLVGGEVTITWSYPTTIAASPAPTPAYFFSSVGLLNLTTLLGTQVTTTGPVSGVYTTKFGSTLLSGLLGGTAYVGVGTVQGTWASTAATATATIPALVGTGTCTIN
ncbi:MAG: hypothetical protein ABI632_05570 [Pseudolysinimonas sp.]